MTGARTKNRWLLASVTVIRRRGSRSSILEIRSHASSEKNVENCSSACRILSYIRRVSVS